METDRAFRSRDVTARARSAITNGFIFGRSVLNRYRLPDNQARTYPSSGRPPVAYPKCLPQEMTNQPYLRPPSAASP